MRLALAAAVLSAALMPQASGAVQDPAVPAGPKVKITFEEGGFVSLVSNGANVREILAEWSRQGGSTFVNSERLVGTPLNLQFAHQPEKDVMASLLRQASGYVLGPRRAGTVGASSFEVVYILPTSNPMAGGYTSTPSYQQPPPPQYSTVGSPDDEIPPVGRGAPPPQPAPGAPPPPGPQPAPNYQPAPAGSGVAVPVVAIPPVSTSTPPPNTGRGGNPGTAGS